MPLRQAQGKCFRATSNPMAPHARSCSCLTNIGGTTLSRVMAATVGQPAYAIVSSSSAIMFAITSVYFGCKGAEQDAVTPRRPPRELNVASRGNRRAGWPQRSPSFNYVRTSVQTLTRCARAFAPFRRAPAMRPVSSNFPSVPAVVLTSPMLTLAPANGAPVAETVTSPFTEGTGAAGLSPHALANIAVASNRRARLNGLLRAMGDGNCTVHLTLRVYRQVHGQEPNKLTCLNSTSREVACYLTERVRDSAPAASIDVNESPTPM